MHFNSVLKPSYIDIPVPSNAQLQSHDFLLVIPGCYLEVEFEGLFEKCFLNVINDYEKINQ